MVWTVESFYSEVVEPQAKALGHRTVQNRRCLKQRKHPELAGKLFFKRQPVPSTVTVFHSTERFIFHVLGLARPQFHGSFTPESKAIKGSIGGL